jgi:hypothetical protein
MVSSVCHKQILEFKDGRSEGLTTGDSNEDMITIKFLFILILRCILKILFFRLALDRDFVGVNSIPLLYRYVSGLFVIRLCSSISLGNSKVAEGLPYYISCV